MTFQPEGKMILPPISHATSLPDLRTMLTSIHKKLGKAGKDAVTKYVDRAGLGERSEILALISEVFAFKVAEKPKAKNNGPN